MEKEFVPYDRALRMKALGFDKPCFGRYGEIDNLEFRFFKEPKSFDYGVTSKTCLAPTFSQAFRWFREKYNLYSQLEYFHSPKWTYSILEFTDLKITPTKIALEYSKERTYEQAELACLDKLLEIVEGIES